jgi:hypothetical protein
MTAGRFARIGPPPTGFQGWWVVPSGTARSIVLRCTLDVRSGSIAAAKPCQRWRQLSPKAAMAALFPRSRRRLPEEGEAGRPAPCGGAGQHEPRRFHSPAGPPRRWRRAYIRAQCACPVPTFEVRPSILSEGQVAGVCSPAWAHGRANDPRQHGANGVRRSTCRAGSATTGRS